MIVLPNGSYSLELGQTNDQDGTVVVTLKFKRVGEVQQPTQDSQFKTVEQVKEILNQTPQTSNNGGFTWGQTSNPETVVQQTPDLEQVRQETQELLTTHEKEPQQIQSNPWGSQQSAQNPVVPPQPVQPGWGQSTQPVQEQTPVVPTQPTSSPWGGTSTTQPTPQESLVPQQTTTAVMEPPPVEEKKPKRGRKPKEAAVVQPQALEINLNGLRSHTQIDGTMIFTKNDNNDINDPYLIKYPSTDGFFSIEVYRPAFNTFEDLLNKYNAQLNETKGCGVLTLNEEMFVTEFLQRMIR